MLRWVVTSGILALFLLATISCRAQESIESILAAVPKPDEYPGMDAVMLLDEMVVRVQSDGSTTRTINQQFCILNQRGLHEYSKAKTRFNTAYERVTLNYARTITPDGREVPAWTTRAETPVEYCEPGIQTDVRDYVIFLSGLEVGAITDISVTVTGDPLLERYFCQGWSFAGPVPIIRSHCTLEIPVGMAFSWTVSGIELQPEIQTVGNVVRYVFRAEDLPVLPREPMQPPIQEIAPALVVSGSSFSSWEPFATWYHGVVTEACVLNEEIVSKTNALIADTETSLEQIRALYRFVADEVRYVQRRSEIVPVPATETFQRRRGNCNDQATLLIAILSVAGFDAYPVLINAGLGAKTDLRLPPNPCAFNHVIVAIPCDQGYLFADPACAACSLNYLDDGIRERKGFLVTDNTGEVVSLDPLIPDKSGAETTVNASISAEGNLVAEIEIDTYGEYDTVYRQIFMGCEGDWSYDCAQWLTSLVIPNVDLVRYELFDWTDREAPVEVNLSCQKPGFAARSGEALRVPVPTPPQTLLVFETEEELFPATLEELVELVEMEARLTPLLTVPQYSRCLLKIEVPEKMTPQLPKDVHSSTDVASYSAHYAFEDGILIIERTLRIDHARITVEQYPSFRSVLLTMYEDIATAIPLVHAN
jgi:hypothetical protein